MERDGVNIFRINPDLAIVPSMVQSVEVCPYRPTGSYVEYYSVFVVYLFGTRQVVAAFSPPPRATWEMVGGAHAWVPVPGYDIDAEIAGCEARAHAVYESILQAVKEAA